MMALHIGSIQVVTGRLQKKVCCLYFVKNFTSDVSNSTSGTCQIDGKAGFASSHVWSAVSADGVGTT